jgi:hypothetical protein
MTTDVFTFMSLRAPNSAEEKNFNARYIKDDYWVVNNKKIYEVVKKERHIGPLLEADKFFAGTYSDIGYFIFKKVFCDYSLKEPEKWINGEIIQSLLDAQFEGQSINCTNHNFPSLTEWEKSPYFIKKDKYYFLPDFDFFESKSVLGKAAKIIKSHLGTHSFAKNDLLKELEAILATKSLISFVFAKSTKVTQTKPPHSLEVLYDEKFSTSKAGYFEYLYIFYILKRETSINLGPFIEGLRVLHVLEMLAIDAFLENKNTITDKELAKALTFIANNMGFKKPFINQKHDLQMSFDAIPVIHPIFSQLAWYRKPFNKIKPIGIADLKVVKQKLLGYEAGEISYIHNVMKGESYEKSHRRLDKTEDTFSFSSEQSSDSEREAQSTDKFEIKREADNVIKNNLQVNANASFTYEGPIVANITGGVSYNTSSEDSQKLSSNFARDVMNKAVSKVQNKASQNRSSTKISEIEEINKHGFINTDPAATHVSGIYRWVDKKYQSQVYNYGKRLMFEFVIPEPAAFYIQSKLKAYEMFELEVPIKPPEPSYHEIKISNPDKQPKETEELKPEYIDERKFIELKKTYDLSDTLYPMGSKWISFVDKKSGETNLTKGHSNSSGNKKWTTDDYIYTLNEKGYNIVGVRIVGSVAFDDNNEERPPSELQDKNKMILSINGEPFWDWIDGGLDAAVYEDLSRVFHYGNPPPLPPIIYFNPRDVKNGGDIVITISFNDLAFYELSFSLNLEYDGSKLKEWQNEVYKKIKLYEEDKIKLANDTIKAKYDAELADYNNKLSALKAQTINDIIQGKSEAYNKNIILKELKKHCITMITKEFDTNANDDIYTMDDAIGNKELRQVPYQKFKVTEDKIKNTATAGYSNEKIDIDYPTIDIPKAKLKGKYVQFLEQAFEWQQLAYIFYPYFWAAENKWISLMNHLDYTDKNMSDFLQAGSVRVLLAVQPSYDKAVLHYLATREPWEGGTNPVIGDPLYLPLFEELHKQQDDLQNAKPEGEPWEFTVPTSLVWLQGSKDGLPGDDEFNTL